MLNSLDLYEYRLLATTVVKMDILLHNAKSKEKIKEKKEETKAIIRTITKDTTQIITKEKELQDLMTDSRMTDENKKTDLKAMKELQIIEIRIRTKEAEVTQETLTRQIEKVNTNEPPHLTSEMLITLTIMKINSK